MSLHRLGKIVKFRQPFGNISGDPKHVSMRTYPTHGHIARNMPSFYLHLDVSCAKIFHVLSRQPFV